MTSLVIQATRTLACLPRALVSLFQRHRVQDPERPSAPTVSELTQVLTAIIDLHSKFYIVIDALDESRQRPLLLEALCSLFEQTSSR